jgi:hypothetical protein
MNNEFTKQVRDSKGRWIKNPAYVKKPKATDEELTAAFIAGYNSQGGYLPLSRKVEMYIKSLKG